MTTWAAPPTSSATRRPASPPSSTRVSRPRRTSSSPTTSASRIEHILETHNHADHVSGHGRLAAATGATIHVHREAAPDYDHEPFDDGWELQLGSLKVRALHTPGHRPEHTAFALIDTARSTGLGRC